MSIFRLKATNCLMSGFVLTSSQNHSSTSKCDINIIEFWDAELAT